MFLTTENELRPGDLFTYDTTGSKVWYLMVVIGVFDKDDETGISSITRMIVWSRSDERYRKISTIRRNMKISPMLSVLVFNRPPVNEVYGNDPL